MVIVEGGGRRLGRRDGPMTIGTFSAPRRLSLSHKYFLELLTSMWKKQVIAILESHEKLKNLKLNVLTFAFSFSLWSLLTHLYLSMNSNYKR